MITIKINGKPFYSLTPLQMVGALSNASLNIVPLLTLQEGDLIEVIAESEDLINTVRETVSYKSDENENC